jgi:hypothetical protein
MSEKLRAAAQAVGDAKDILFLREMSVHDKVYLRLEDAINAIKAALAEQTVKESLTVAVQERMHPEIKKMYEDYFDKYFRELSAQQRPWVGLTEDEITKLHHEIKVQLMGTYKTEDIYRAIEAKLKEKNIEHI